MLVDVFKRLSTTVGIFLLSKGGNVMPMIDVYVALIMVKSRTIERVPEHLRADVLKGLNAIGLDGYGNPLPVEPPTEPTEPGADA